MLPMGSVGIIIISSWNFQSWDSLACVRTPVLKPSGFHATRTDRALTVMSGPAVLFQGPARPNIITMLEMGGSSAIPGVLPRGHLWIWPFFYIGYLDGRAWPGLAYRKATGIDAGY